MTDSFYAGGGIGLGPRPEPPAPPAYPAPEITSRDGVTGPEKRAVVALEELARAHGWLTRVTYAKGHLQHGTTGKPGAVRDSLAVRMVRGAGDYAVAVYVDRGHSWSWETMWHAGQRKPVGYDTINTFLDAVFGPATLIAPYPWANCPMVTTAAWNPPYIRTWL